MVDPLLAGFDMPVMIDFAASRIWRACVNIRKYSW
jgi:hypothetical protein